LKRFILQIGYLKELYYPVLITPKDANEIEKFYSELSPELDNTSVLIELACWLVNTGKFTNTGLVNKQIR
jgi:hypothetical protein